ncbi:TorD/DmsD family molecular chaperone [Bacillus benzoevorans]|uniref:TorA maturation chaperone TorD n=1 Tax=Bacillus benzoevorans TaxID=1456 RepID=A0A7X0HTL5_9BACI|nr:molecular chaperone TorD family protein [Bacillus benzoevorans]MBB6446625.1 TorA maturation chaperone TorD [Bacillus benzoevorans]
MKESWDDVWSLRSALYSFFANSLLEPIQGSNTVVFTKNSWNNFPIKCANPQMQSGIEWLLNCAAKLEAFSKEEATEQVMIEYTSLFLGPGLPNAPLWESFYRTSEKIYFGRTTFEMKAMLSAHGLESKHKNQQPEDHIGLELLLLSVFSDNIAKCELEQQVSQIRKQIAFIDEHLLSWIHELCRDAKEHATVGFYGGLIELIWGVLLWDRELLEEFVKSHEQAFVSSV